jgi:eukaryotic-like serine/threonine-protein kinase
MVGQNIGKYRVVDRIGRGGMGTVYRAVDETLHRDVAIKVLNAELNDPAVAKRFRAEAITVARLNHPGIATVYELFQHEGEWLMVMEFVRGETLEALVNRLGPLPVDRASELTMQALGALAHAHSMGVVHRDLKPANLMVTASGAVKIMDFGIARVAGAEHLTSAGFMMGTPAYMAPEQVLGGEIDARTDIYAMGVVLYHLITAKLPFKGETPMEMAQSRIQDEPTPVRTARHDLPAWLDHVLDIALSRDPARRFPSAPVFREAISRGLANLPIETPEPTAIHPELVATAAPRSMPIVAAPEVPRATQPPASAMPTMISSGAAATPPAAGGRGRLIAAAALVVLVALPALWLITRSRTGAPAEAEAAPAAVLPADAGRALAQPAGAADAPAATVAPSAEGPTPANRGTPTGPAPLASPAAGNAAAPTAPATTAPAAGGGRPAAGRGGASLPLLTFQGVRFLVVAGKKADDVPATVNFTDAQVAVVSDSGASLAVMPYRDVTYALYTRGRDPKWSVVLASPPPDVDLPGGIFSSARHWLALQSRSSYIILRLNDSDWQRVADTVTARAGVPVERR